MDDDFIQSVGQFHFGRPPTKVIHKTIGICNEVYELQYGETGYILRYHTEKDWIYGTHRFLPLFKKLDIKTPDILAEDYSKADFPFCYQIQTKLEGEDLGLVIDRLNSSELTEIAKDIAVIFRKLKTLPAPADFGGISGLDESHHNSFFEIWETHRVDIHERNSTSQVLDAETLGVYDHMLSTFEDHLKECSPTLYFDDMSYKNVMIHQGAFNGLVDLDFLSKGDDLSALGAMKACWYGEPTGEFYLDEIMRALELDSHRQRLVKVYAIFHLTMWTTEEGIKFNENSSTEINWDNVMKKRKAIRDLQEEVLFEK